MQILGQVSRGTESELDFFFFFYGIPRCFICIFKFGRHFSKGVCLNIQQSVYLPILKMYFILPIMVLVFLI